MSTDSEARAALIGLTLVAQDEVRAVLNDFATADPDTVRDVLAEALPALGYE